MTNWLAAVVESSDDAIISKSLDGIVQSWNRGAERLLGYTAEEMIGQPITRLEPPHRAGEIAALLERLRNGEIIEHMETERIAKDGRVIAVSLTVSPVRDGAGRIVGASKIARDISARKAVEAALRASEQRYRALVDTQVEMLCRFRLDGTILFVNAAYARTMDTTPEALTGANFWSFIPEADRPALRDALLGMTPDAPILRVDNRLETPSGTLWTLWTNRALAFDDDGRLLEAQSTGIDITERKNMEEQLRTANERQREFLAMLGHELRNPLAPLRSGLDLLERTANDPDVDKIRALMDRQVRHLTRLVDDLVDIGRINRGRIALRREVVDLHDVIESAIELSSAAIADPGHELRFERGAPVLVYGDFDRLAQVVSNLLNNAGHYSPPNSRIAVTLAEDDGEILLRVTDTGRGFPPALAELLFDLFARLPSSEPRPADEGLGIGLPLARQLVELHGGTISAASEGPGKGSTFEIRLPRPADTTQANAAPAGTAAAVRRRPGNRQLRVLVVDDNADAANSIALLLGHFGHVVEVVNDGKAALAIVDSFVPDVVLLDIGMPQMDGYAVARELRARPSGAAARVFALTGWGQEHDRQRATDAGFDAHFTKPVDVQALLGHIDEQD